MAPVDLIEMATSLRLEWKEKKVQYGIAVLPFLHRSQYREKCFEIAELIEDKTGCPVIYDSMGSVARRWNRYDERSVIHVTVDDQTFDDNTVMWRDENGEIVRISVGAEKKYDCSVLKAADVDAFRAYLNDPNAISEDAAQGAIRAKKLAKKLGLDYL